jgi:hypothetical protein
MQMRLPLVAVLLLAPGAAMSPAPAAGAAPVHPCASHAAAQARKLLRFHTDADERAEVFGDRARIIGSIKALRGKGRLDVIEVPGGVYKASYRMRLIYAQIPGSCVLMGQEIVEESDPY